MDRFPIVESIFVNQSNTTRFRFWLAPVEKGKSPPQRISRQFCGVCRMPTGIPDRQMSCVAGGVCALNAGWEWQI